MSDNTLVINCGSSSLKFAVFDTIAGKCLIKGLAEPLCSKKPTLSWSTDQEKHKIDLPTGADLSLALETISEKLLANIEIEAIGHRVVHGAEKFKSSALIDDAMIAQVEACNHLAPLHNPANLLGIRIAKKIFKGVPHVGVFDTAFHQSIPEEAYIYPIPYKYYIELGVRRYGFHGTSHHYVYRQAARILGKSLKDTAVITVHLGNGCSATAAQGGESRDTTMGLTPLEGLVMGTRCGDIDPSLPGFLCREAGLKIEEVDEILNKKSGLLGISGISNDMREILDSVKKGDPRAKLAVKIFVFRLAKSIAALRVSLDDCDAIVFTGGIGENSAPIRKRVLDRLSHLGVKVDDEANDDNGRKTNGLISLPGGDTAAYVIPTNEELMIAQETAETIAHN